jgi:hypothetical protein
LKDTRGNWSFAALFRHDRPRLRQLTLSELNLFTGTAGVPPAYDSRKHLRIELSVRRSGRDARGPSEELVWLGYCPGRGRLPIVFRSARMTGSVLPEIRIRIRQRSFH